MKESNNVRAERIARLERFRDAIAQYSTRGSSGRRSVIAVDGDQRSELRTLINREAHWVRRQVIEAGCFQTVTIGPPPAVGGLIAHDVDPFGSMFDPPYGRDLFSLIVDMVERTVGVISATEELNAASPPELIKNIRRNFAFVAMAIDDGRLDLVDVLDAIKEAANRCGIQAERIDDEKSNERITDRILESIRVAEHVIVDLTDERPNVFFEAGFAHGIGKTPIYVAKHGTKLHFDLKDYPVIFFKNYKQLKDDLEARLRAVGRK